MKYLLYLFLLVQFNSFCQSEVKIFFSEKEFCIVNENKDSTIIFGTYSQDSNFVILNGRFSFNMIDTSSLKILDFKKKILNENFNFETQSADSYYENKFSEYCNLFVKYNLINADLELRNTLNIVDPKLKDRYVLISDFLTIFSNDSLSFLKEEFASLNRDTTNFHRLAKYYHENNNYEKALIYSKKFLLKNKEFNDESYDITMIFELSNVTFEFNNKYALFTNDNHTLNDLFEKSGMLFSKTILVSKTWW